MYVGPPTIKLHLWGHFSQMRLAKRVLLFFPGLITLRCNFSLSKHDYLSYRGVMKEKEVRKA